MSTVRTESIEYRYYELRATEWLGRWQVGIYPTIEDLPHPLPEDRPSAPTLDEAFSAGRWRVDRLYEAMRGSDFRGSGDGRDDGCQSRFSTAVMSPSL